MLLEEFADIIGCNLIVLRHANQKGRWTAGFENVEVKNDKHDKNLSGGRGEGKTMRDAVNDYINNINGKWLVVNAGGEDRREYGVPFILRR